MVLRNDSPTWFFVLALSFRIALGADDEYNVLHRDGSYEFGYNNPDSYHYADANRNNVVRGEFGGRNPGTGAIDSTVYTAGPRGYRPRGKNVARKYDLNQSGLRPVGSRDDPYYDPFEDPSYSFGFRTRTYNREENANRAGDVNGRYSYVDDVGERHNVEFVAGKKTGFHVKTPFPDSNPRGYGPLYFNGRGKPIPRGRTSIQRGTDGSYRFVSSGPDQRRTEVSDSTGHVRGSYTYLDDKGVQHSVHYIAGPETGYRVLKQVKGPHLPTVFPFSRPGIVPPDFYDDPDPKEGADLFDTAASGHVKPPAPAKPSGSRPITPLGNELDDGPNLSKPGKPSYLDEDPGDFGDLFGGGTSKPDDGSYRPSAEDDGSYRPPGSSSTTSRPKPGDAPGTTSKPGEDGYESGPIPTPDFEEKPTTPSYKPGGTKPPGGSFRPPSAKPGSSFGPPGAKPPGGSFGPPGAKPSYDYSNEVDDHFGLFGSETGHPRPPYGGEGGGATITFGVTNDCAKCAQGGTLVTNVGDRTFLVPPGVSVRAHVQAIDLLPISPRVPSPSEQYKVDLHRKTEQLNAVEDSIVGRNDTSKVETETSEEYQTTTVPVTTTTPSAQSKSNSTSTGST